ncbi:MAG TPA: PilZ domain-containing protein [Paenisporosarcina sp.]|nr:PilZ domain-containing protein [Paenisporosarcina sp.]
MSENRREYFRVNFKETLNGEIVFTEGDTMFVCIENLSVKGMGFNSAIEIPLYARVGCRFEILDSPFLIEGSIIRKVREATEIQYGIDFEVDREISSQLFKVLNTYQIHQRKG